MNFTYNDCMNTHIFICPFNVISFWELTDAMFINHHMHWRDSTKWNPETLQPWPLTQRGLVEFENPSLIFSEVIEISNSWCNVLFKNVVFLLKLRIWNRFVVNQSTIVSAVEVINHVQSQCYNSLIMFWSNINPFKGDRNWSTFINFIRN